MTKYIESEAVIELFNKWADGYSYIEVPTKDAIACVRAIPAADAIEKLTDNHVGKWIPVTERLPEICERDVNGNITFSEKVWSCIDCGDGFYWQQTDQYTTNCGGGWMSEVPEDGFTPKVVAWMPLPEPYEVK